MNLVCLQMKIHKMRFPSTLFANAAHTSQNHCHGWQPSKHAHINQIYEGSRHQVYITSLPKVDSYGASTSSKFRIEGAGQLQFFGTPRYIIAIIFKSQTIGSSDRFRIIQIRCSGAGLPYNSALFISQPVVLTIWSTPWACSRLFPQTIWATGTERIMPCTMLYCILQVLWFLES